MARRPLLSGLLALALAVGGGVAAWFWLADRVAQSLGWARTSQQSRGSLQALGVYGEVPGFALTERSGRRITREDLQGRISIVDFFYTECTDTCSLQSASMAQLQVDFIGEPAVRLVSISVDPEHDTPEVLLEYAARFRADPERWLFLTGPRRAIYQLAIEGFKLGVVDEGEKAEREPSRARLGPDPAWAHPVPNPNRKSILHSSRFVLVDRLAQIRGYYHGTEQESLRRLRESVKVLLREK